MLGFLFGRLTAASDPGAALFSGVTALAREPHWYLEGQVPDTLDGRFAVLSTIMALVLVRLEQQGDAAKALSVALTERFIDVMDSEHRQLGLGDPTLGKTVRKLVGALARRTDLWRSAVGGEAPWDRAATDSLYKGREADGAVRHSAEALRALWETLRTLPITALEEGKLS